MNNLLCQGLPVPPASVEFVPPEPPSGPRTTRQALEQSVANPQCGACHRFIDPIGFAFEGYDAAGVHRRSEKGLPIDSSGVLNGAFDDESLNGRWADANDLSAWIPKQAAFKSCVAEQYWRYATGIHINSEEDSCTVKRLTKVLQRPGSGLRELVLETLSDPGFRQVPLGDANDVAAPIKGVPEGRTPEETTALVAASDFETAASSLPKESRDILKQWSILFSDMAKRFAAGKP